jgi:TRAP-type transport system small permease protein
VQDVAVDLLSAAALFGMAWLMWVKAGQMSGFGDTTALLKIPQGPFVYAMSALLGITALVHLLLVLRPVKHHHIGVDA